MNPPVVAVARVALKGKVEQRTVGVVHADNLWPPIAVDVHDGVSFQPLFGALMDDVFGEVALAIVLKPVQADIGVSGDDVQHAVAGEVGGANAIGIVVAIGDQMLREAD